MATACFGFKGSTGGYEETLKAENLATLFILGIMHCLSSQNHCAATTNAAEMQENKYSQDDALNAMKRLFWDGDPIKEGKIGFQNAIKEVVQQIRMARLIRTGKGRKWSIGRVASRETISQCVTKQ